MIGEHIKAKKGSVKETLYGTCAYRIIASVNGFHHIMHEHTGEIFRTTWDDWEPVEKEENQ
jgi:hypothetical protein